MKKIILLIGCMLLLTSFVSAAFDFDNIDHYYPDTKTMEIKNSVLGFEWWELSPVANVTLLSPEEVKVIRGEERLVAWYKIENLEEYDGESIFRVIDLYDMKNGNAPLSRNFKFKEKYIEVIEKPVYDLVCYGEGNETACYNEQVGTIESELEEWKAFNQNNPFQAGEHIIGLFTEVKPNDYVEWIPEMYGVRIEEWAAWSDSLEVGLIGYWSFDIDGSDNWDYAIDFTTPIEATHYETGGIHGGYYNLTGTTTQMNTTYNSLMDIPKNYTVIYWIKDTASTGKFMHNLVEAVPPSTDEFYFKAYDNGASTEVDVFTDTPPETNTQFDIGALNVWKQLIHVYNGSHIAGGINGAILSTSAVTGSARGNYDGTGTFNLGASYQGVSSWDGGVDELLIWNRSLSEQEVADMYNGGTPIYPTSVTDFYPEAALISPTNETILHYTNLTVNCTGGDDDLLENVSLILNGELNYTKTFGTGNYTSLDYTITAIGDGVYTWTCNVSDNATTTQQNTTGAYTVTIDTTPDIDFLSPTPSNATNQTVDSFIVNVSISEAYFKNLTFLLSNDTDEIKRVHFTNSSRYINFSGLLDDSYYYNVTVWTTTEQSNVTAHRSISIDNSAPTLNITYPAEYINIIQIYNNISINWSVSDDNLESCWGTFDNGLTNITLECLDLNMSINITDISNNSFIIYANDTFGNERGFTRDWVYKIFINNQTYNTSVYETDRGDFLINVTHDETETLTAVLYYNETNRGAATKTEEGNETIFRKSIDLALIDGEAQNISFFWSFTRGSENINSTPLNQTVDAINLTSCTIETNITVLNFTLLDESNQTKINATETVTDFEANFYFWKGLGNIAKNYSYQVLQSNTISNYTFCISPNVTLKSNMSSLYSADGYSPREYNLNNASLNYNASNIVLYLLNDSSSVKFTITVKEGVTELTGAYVSVSKFFVGEGIFKTISIRTTDDLGKFSEYLELDRDYKFSVVHNGQLMGIVPKRAICEASPCELTIQVDETQGDVWTDYYEHYATNIASNLSFNQTQDLVTYDFIDITGLANYFRLEVYRVMYNETENQICNNYAYASSGTLTCNLSGYEGDFVAMTYISRSPEKVDQVLTIVISEFVADMGKIGLFFTLIVVITFVFAGGAISQGNPTVMISMFGLAILGCKLMTILPYSWGVVSGIEILVITVIALLRT